MVYTEEIIQVYIDEYETESKKKRKNMVRPKDFRERLTRLEKAMKRTKAAQVTSRYLEESHRQIRNLAYFAYRSKDTSSLSRLNERLLPELVRLDLTMFLPTQQEDISQDFLNHLKTELTGELCSRPLFELYQSYKRFVIEYKIMDLVPARPELEFPETLRMNRHFILHIGPTNSGKTFHSLERLKSAENGIYLGPLRLLALEVYEKMHDYGVPCTMLTGQECIADDHSRITASTIEMADFSQTYDVAVIDEAQMTADPASSSASLNAAAPFSIIFSLGRSSSAHWLMDSLCLLSMIKSLTYKNSFETPRIRPFLLYNAATMHARIPFHNQLVV